MFQIMRRYRVEKTDKSVFFLITLLLFFHKKGCLFREKGVLYNNTSI